MKYDEPEAAVLLVACAIGLATGAACLLLTTHMFTVMQCVSPFGIMLPSVHRPHDYSFSHSLPHDNPFGSQQTMVQKCDHDMLVTGAGVVFFNELIHTIRDFIWPSTPVNNANWTYWARDLPLSERWLTLLLPPTCGGLAVGVLRYFSKGFDNPPPSELQQQQQETGQQQKLPRADSLPAQPTQTTQSSSDTSTPLPSSPASVLAEQRISAASSNGTESRSETGSSNSRASRINSNGEASTSSSSSTAWSLPWGKSSSASLQRQVLSVTRPVLKATAAAITLGTGNSLGPEGPSVEIGRAAARGLGTVLKSKQRRLLALVAAGSGAGDAL